MLNYAYPSVARLARAARQHHEVAAGMLAVCRKDTKESIQAYHAIYVGGYAVECGLKAMYLNCSPEPAHKDLIDVRIKELGHNLLGCYDTVRQQFRQFMPPPLLDRFRRAVQAWDVRMRYWSGKKRVADAKVFLNTAADILSWTGVK